MNDYEQSTHDQVTGTPKWAPVPESVLYAPISDRAVRMFAILARHGDQAFPGMKRVAELLRCDERTARRTREELERADLLTVTPRRRPDGSQASNLYDLSPAYRGRAAVSGGGGRVCPPMNESKGNERTTRAADSQYSADFQRFWDIYPPKKTSVKKLAWKAWQARLAEGVTVADLTMAAKNYARERDGQNETYTLQAQTFLGPNERWVPYAKKPTQGGRVGTADDIGYIVGHDMRGNPIYA